MTIRKRRDTREDGTVRERWQIDFWVYRPDGTKKRVRRVLPDGTTKRQAQQMEQAMRAEENARSAHADWTTETFGAFAQRWLDDFVGEHNKPSTHSWRASMLRNHLIPELGRIPVRAIGLADIERLLAALNEKTKSNGGPLAASTKQKILNTARSILRKAQEWGDAPRDAFRWKWPKIVGEAKKTEPISEGDAERFEEIEDPRLQGLLVFTLHTGLRIGELRALRWKDVELGESPQVVVRRNYSKGVLTTPKSGKSRTIPLNRIAAAALPERGRSEDPVFTRIGTPLSESQARRLMIQARELTGIGDLRWHRLRHTFATRLAELNTPVHALQALMGHASILTTMGYVHAQDHALRDAVARLEPPTTAPQRREDGAFDEILRAVEDLQSGRPGMRNVEITRDLFGHPRVKRRRRWPVMI